MDIELTSKLTWCLSQGRIPGSWKICLHLLISYFIPHSEVTINLSLSPLVQFTCVKSSPQLLFLGHPRDSDAHRCTCMKTEHDTSIEIQGNFPKLAIQKKHKSGKYMEKIRKQKLCE